MKKTILIALLLLPAIFCEAAVESCEALKQKIAAKIDAKGVAQYTLTIVPAIGITLHHIS